MNLPGNGKINLQNLKVEYLLNFSIIAAILLFTAKSIEFSLTLSPNMDEGAYLFQGLSYARGTYQFLQPYGFFTGKIYLSYFIWGWIQLLFGPGLTSPRLFTILLNLLSISGIYLTVRKISPLWAQSILFWSIAINFSLIKILSIANSQVIIFFLMVWILYFFLSFEKETPGVIIGTILLGLMIFTRENMIFFVFPALAYIFWEKGRKKGFISLFVFIFIFVAGNALFYPQILKLWMAFVPKLFRSIGTEEIVGISASRYQSTFSTKFQSVMNSMRMFSIEYFGILGSLFILFKNFSKSFLSSQKKLIFLLISYVILFLTHFLAAVGLSYCPYCLSSYSVFFIPIGFIILMLFLNLQSNNYFPLSHQVLVFTFNLFLFIICLSYSNIIGNYFFRFPIPIFHGVELPTFIPIGNLFINKLNLPNQIIRQIISTFVGIVSILLITIFSILLNYFRPTHFFHRKLLLLLFIFCLLGIRILPILKIDNYCRENTITGYEKLGKKISQIIPENSTIYIEGPKTAIALLYLKQINIFPPQINGTYSFSKKLEDDNLLSNGKWNSNLKSNWLNTANVLILEKEAKEIFENSYNPMGYKLYILNIAPPSCQSNMSYYVYIKK